MATPAELSDFLKSVEKRAFMRTNYHVRNDESAFDIVQDSMMKLAEHYGDKPALEFPMLFQRILTNCTMDWFRRQKVRNGLFSSFSDFQTEGEDDSFDLLESLSTATPAPAFDNPETQNQRAQTLQAIEQELLTLPNRQREAFLLRYWEDMDVAETAATMGCSQGSVKTHCSRAIHALLKTLTAKGIRL
ncbi:RNA polymerase sigma factor [Rhodoferax sp.]|uniref:RNA polymerase sigma factor n=1 Tax=Rhodoferax sp. TaxID=50421 RepID=UPI00260E6685|nr:RNA polymerase sigma factor [Rhodoferax sp.]MDD5480856.1 RNA polymerase sigma factor [Rhodoferax sp.]